MAVILVEGIRGGVGATSIVAGLAWALQLHGEKVLVLDCSSDNLLRILFGLPVSQHTGWALSFIEQRPWHEQLVSYTPQLDVLPFASLAPEHLLALRSYLTVEQDFLKKSIGTLIHEKAYNWVLIDASANDHLLLQQSTNASTARLCITNCDANSLVRLQQRKADGSEFLLVNKFNPASQLQCDLKKLWQNTLQSLIPVFIHLDEAVSEAFAFKQPVGRYAPSNMSAQDMTSLACWCQATLSRYAA